VTEQEASFIVLLFYCVIRSRKFTEIADHNNFIVLLRVSACTIIFGRTTRNVIRRKSSEYTYHMLYKNAFYMYLIRI
jgi:hypothetical protein